MKTKIEQFDSASCRLLAEEIMGLLKPLEEKYGIVLNQKSGNYSPENFVFKVELSTMNKSGGVNTREAENFNRLAKFYGLKQSDLGRKFNHFGKIYKIVGLKPRSKKYPLLAENENGKVFKFPVLAAQTGFVMMSKSERS